MKRLLHALPLLLLPLLASADAADSAWMAQNYTKREVHITMRDGVHLFTAIYEPKDKKEKHPFLLNRTPYSIAPYGAGNFKAYWNTPYIAYFKKNYIIVLQDVRGKYMSEGEFMDVRPYNPNNDRTKTDEASDTYDTIDWLLDSVQNKNKKVGVFGISDPGFYATEAALCNHPALVAVSPQAPVTEWFLGDDFHHNGAFMEADAFNFYSGFGKPRPKPTTQNAPGFQHFTQDNYNFYLRYPTLKDLAKDMGDSIKFWKDLYNHPDYDQWWEERNARKYVKCIPKHTATLVVGGLYDAEDCFGAWNLYKAIEEKAPNNNKLVMGPWSHGGWVRTTGEYLGNVRFGNKVSEWYQQQIEQPFFDYYLLGKGDIKNIKEATIFFSGANEWRTFNQWPTPDEHDTRMYLNADGSMTTTASEDGKKHNDYTSNPDKPVPYTEAVGMRRTNEYMTDDQRFASRRPDVLVYQTEQLTEDMTLGGPVTADLFASLSTTDADFVVKLIDVFPDDFKYDTVKDGKGNGKDYPMGGYQMLVRGEIMRGRYRNSFTYPEAFTPDKITEVSFKLPDVAHVFKKGHRLMVQIQSTWFPLADRNPQQFVNIYTADKKDFVSSDISIWCGGRHASSIVLPTLR